MIDAFIVIDIQKDYFLGGAMELVGAEAAADRAAAALHVCRSNRIPIIHVQHINIVPEATFFVDGTEGVKIHEKVAPEEGETVILKNYPNAFRDTMLGEALDKLNARHLGICGMMTFMCVDASVRAAVDRGHRVNVLHDACASRDLQFGDRVTPAADVQASFMAALGLAYAQVLPTGEFLMKCPSCT